jgi:hypothetical protein
MIVTFTLPDILFTIVGWTCLIALWLMALTAIAAMVYYIHNRMFKNNAIYRFCLYNAGRAWFKNDKEMEHWYLTITTKDGVKHYFKKLKHKPVRRKK